MRTTEGNEPAKSDSPNNNVNYETDSEILPSQVLDNMVKDILEATENDPSYDTIVEECIEACKFCDIYIFNTKYIIFVSDL